MRISTIVLILLLLCASSASAFNTGLVPQGHWIYEAIEELVETDLVPEYQIKSEISRYDAAMLISRVIQRIDQSNSDGVQRFGVSKDVVLSDLVLRYNSQQKGDPITTNESRALYRLALEFHSELEVLGYLVKDEQQAPETLVQQTERLFATERQLTFDQNTLQSLKRQETHVAVNPLHLTVANPSKSFWMPNYPIAPRYELLEEMRFTDLSFTNLTASSAERSSREWFPAESRLVTLDGQIPLSNELILGATHTKVEYLGDHSEETPGVASLGGQYIISPDVILEGQYLYNTETSAKGTAMQVGATVRLGELEVGGSFRALQSGFRPVSSPELVGDGGTGYELTFKLGDLILSTVRDRMQFSDSSQSQITTSVDVSYGLPNSVLLKAGYRQTDLDSGKLADLGAPAVTSLGVDIPIPQGRLQLGLTSETGDGQYVSLDPEEEDGETGEKKESSARTTATLGLSYSVGQNASFQFNYKLIDFSEFMKKTDEPSANMATAEFTIRF